MSNTYFQFKEFVIHQEKCGMKVCTDSCVFGAWAARWIKDKKRILDIGAGTGLLMLMLAQKSSAIIDGIEIEPACFEQLTLNLEESIWKDRLSAVAADVRHFSFKEKYDFIISNPPFFASHLVSQSNTNKIARHSIHLSLHELFNIVVNLLTEDGNFALLLPYHRLAEAEEISLNRGLKIINQVDVFQTIKHQPFRVLLMFGKQASQPLEISTLVIKNGSAYTHEFVELLQDYYLKLKFS